MLQTWDGLLSIGVIDLLDTLQEIFVSVNRKREVYVEVTLSFRIRLVT